MPRQSPIIPLLRDWGYQGFHCEMSLFVLQGCQIASPMPWLRMPGIDGRTVESGTVENKAEEVDGRLDR